PNLIEAVGNRLPARQAGKVVDVDCPRLTLPGTAGVAEVANQLFFLGIHTDDRPLAPQKRPADLGNVAQLLIPSRRLSPRQPFAIDAQRVPLLAQQAADHGGAKLIAPPQGPAKLTQRLMRPSESRNRIPGCGILQQGVQDLQEFGPFFSTRLRPPPARRIRPLLPRSICSISRRPRKMVVRLSPVTRAMCWTPPWPNCAAHNP